MNAITRRAARWFVVSALAATGVACGPAAEDGDSSSTESASTRTADPSYALDAHTLEKTVLRAKARIEIPAGVAIVPIEQPWVPGYEMTFCEIQLREVSREARWIEPTDPVTIWDVDHNVGTRGRQQILLELTDGVGGVWPAWADFMISCRRSGPPAPTRGEVVASLSQVFRLSDR